MQCVNLEILKYKERIDRFDCFDMFDNDIRIIRNSKNDKFIVQKFANFS